MKLVEEKKKWNLAVYRSIADEFDRITAEHRGDKGTCASAACLMWLVADADTRQQYVDVLKLAEGRGRMGSVLEAAIATLGDASEPKSPAVAGSLPHVSPGVRERQAAKRAPESRGVRAK
jgi:hypothetical protein